MKYILIMIFTVSLFYSCSENVPSNDLSINKFTTSVVDTFYASDEFVSNMNCEIKYKISDTVYVILEEAAIKGVNRIRNSKDIINSDSVRVGYTKKISLNPNDSTYIYNSDWYSQLCIIKIPKALNVYGRIDIKATF
jgi:hypothetical protein